MHDDGYRAEVPFIPGVSKTVTRAGFVVSNCQRGHLRFSSVPDRPSHHRTLMQYRYTHARGRLGRIPERHGQDSPHPHRPGSTGQDCRHHSACAGDQPAPASWRMLSRFPGIIARFATTSTSPPAATTTSTTPRWSPHRTSFPPRSSVTQQSYPPSPRGAVGWRVGNWVGRSTGERGASTGGARSISIARGPRPAGATGGGPEYGTESGPPRGPLRVATRRAAKKGASPKVPAMEEAVRSFLGVPKEGAVERLSVVCAHCNAKLTPKEMDYGCDPSRLAVKLRPVFDPLRRDDATNAFLMRSSRRPYPVNWGMSAACTYLRKYMSLTDANAVLGRGKMHVLSREQAADLMRESLEAARSLGYDDDAAPRTLLDVGAGEGEVTEKLRDGGGFRAVVATEASEPMVRRLREKNFDCVVSACDVSGVLTEAKAAGVPMHPDGFDGIALLNVLDRCDTPFTLLSQLRAMLRPDVGRLVLAVVIPFRPFVEDGKAYRAPKERLGLPSNGSWENGVNQLWERVIKPSGFRVERLARVPYISEGDQKHGAYILDDAVFVLSVPSAPAGAAEGSGAEEEKA